MFELYQEPIWIPYLLSSITLVLSFLIWFMPVLVIRNADSLEKQSKTSIFYVIGIALTFVVLNYFLNFQNIWTIILIYVASSIYIYYLNIKKSIKWISISLLLFILTILSMYTFMNYKLIHISYIFFSVNDISTYKFSMKPYLTIYKIGEELGTITFTLEGEDVVCKNDNLLFRIFGVYSAMNCLTFLIWLWIYNTVLGFHGFILKKKH